MEDENKLSDFKRKLIKDIALRIQKASEMYPHLKGFNLEKNTSDDWISYSNNVTAVPNPNYDEEKKKQREMKKKNPGMLRHEIPETIDTYDEKDGIAITIQLFSEEEANSMQRQFYPFVKINDFYLDLNIFGAQTDSVKEIKALIEEIILGIKFKYETGV